jgi:hypothetical protein
MTKLVATLAAVACFVAAEAVHDIRWKFALFLAASILSGALAVHRAYLRRKAGQNWHGVLADGSRLITGSVWLDGILFIMILAALGGSIWMATLVEW